MPVPATTETLLEWDCLRIRHGPSTGGKELVGGGPAVPNPDGFASLGRQQEVRWERWASRGFLAG